MNKLQKLIFKEKFDNDADLYFYTGMLPLQNFGKPFVVDFEHVYALFGYNKNELKHKKRVFDLLASNECKYILPWSNAAEKSMRLFFGEKSLQLESKVVILYPALPSYKSMYKNNRDNCSVSRCNKIKFLFVGKDYRRKGLIELLEAFSVLLAKYSNIELFCVTECPSSLRDKYADMEDIHFVKACFNQEDVIKKYFLTCDVFVMPTHEDTFGMVIMEALSCGLPVITTKQFACKEMIRDGQNGLFVDSDILFLDMHPIPSDSINGANYNGVEKKLVDSLIDKISIIIENPSLLKSIKSNAGKDFLSNGKFSIRRRNMILKKVFQESVNE